MGALVSRKTLLGAVAIGAIALGIWACDSRSQNNSAASPQLPAKFSTLAADKKAFLNDPQILARFGLTPEKLQLAIADFDFPALDRYVSTLMATVESEKFHPGDDHDAETALNPAAIRYNAGTTLRPAILDEYQRDAGRCLHADAVGCHSGGVHAPGRWRPVGSGLPHLVRVHVRGAAGRALRL